MRISILVTDIDDKSKIDIESDELAIKPILLTIKQAIVNAVGAKSAFIKPYIDNIYNITHNKLLDGLQFKVKTKNGKIPITFSVREIIIEEEGNND